MSIPQEVSQDFTTQLQTELANSATLSLPKSWLIDKAVLIDALGLNPELLADFSGIRIYPGAKMEESVSQANLTVTLITVAVDYNGNDIVGNVPSNVKSGSLRYDYAAPCPHVCPNNITDLFTNSKIYNLNK